MESNQTNSRVNNNQIQSTYSIEQMTNCFSNLKRTPSSITDKDRLIWNEAQECFSLTRKNYNVITNNQKISKSFSFCCDKNEKLPCGRVTLSFNPNYFQLSIPHKDASVVLNIPSNQCSEIEVYKKINNLAKIFIGDLHRVYDSNNFEQMLEDVKRNSSKSIDFTLPLRWTGLDLPGVKENLSMIVETSWQLMNQQKLLSNKISEFKQVLEAINQFLPLNSQAERSQIWASITSLDLLVNTINIKLDKVRSHYLLANDKLRQLEANVKILNL